jgi:hypothetical protein
MSTGITREGTVREGTAWSRPRQGLIQLAVVVNLSDRVLRPLMAGDQPQAPPPLRQALRTIDHEVSLRLATARLPAAA